MPRTLFAWKQQHETRYTFGHFSVTRHTPPTGPPIWTARHRGHEIGQASTLAEAQRYAERYAR